MERIVFSCGDEEHLPIVTGYGHNLKLHNVCLCEFFEKENNGLFRKLKMITNLNSKRIEITLIQCNDEGFWKFIEGCLSVSDKKIKIIDYKKYSSLQIEEWCYDNIHAIRLAQDISS